MKKIFFVLYAVLTGFTLLGQNKMVLDATFGQDGVAIFPPEMNPLGLLSQQNGKTVTFGLWSDTLYNYSMRLFRFNPDGTADASFGQDGLVKTDIPWNHYTNLYHGNIQPDGKILVAGIGSKLNGFNYESFLVRYDQSGNLDPAFGANGQLSLRMDTASVLQSGNLIVQNDLKILIPLSAETEVDSTPIQVPWLIRLQSNGQRDSSFGVDGIVKFPLTSFSKILKIGPSPDHGVYVMGYYKPANYKLVLLHILEDGTIDPGFQTNFTYDNMNDFPNAADMLIQPDGKLLIAGHRFPRVNMLRINPEGTLDNTFGGDGLIEDAISLDYRRPKSVILQPDGKYTVLFLNSSYFLLARYNPNGSLDYSMDLDGLYTLPLSTSNFLNHTTGISIQPDGKLIVVGGVDGKLFAARYLEKACSGNTP